MPRKIALNRLQLNFWMKYACGFGPEVQILRVFMVNGNFLTAQCGLPYERTTQKGHIDCAGCSPGYEMHTDVKLW